MVGIVLRKEIKTRNICLELARTKRKNGVSNAEILWYNNVCQIPKLNMPGNTPERHNYSPSPDNEKQSLIDQLAKATENMDEKGVKRLSEQLEQTNYRVQQETNQLNSRLKYNPISYVANEEPGNIQTKKPRQLTEEQRLYAKLTADQILDEFKRRFPKYVAVTDPVKGATIPWSKKLNSNYRLEAQRAAVARVHCKSIQEFDNIMSMDSDQIVMWYKQYFIPKPEKQEGKPEPRGHMKLDPKKVAEFKRGMFGI